MYIQETSEKKQKQIVSYLWVGLFIVFICTSFRVPDFEDVRKGHRVHPSLGQMGVGSHVARLKSKQETR